MEGEILFEKWRKCLDNLEFSSLMIPIDTKAKGLLRLCVEWNIKMLELKVELHRLMIDLNDVKMVNTIMKGIIEKCDQNPLNNDSIFSTINSRVVGSFKYNYYQLEDLSEKFKFINEYSDLSEEIEFPGNIFGWKFRLFVRDIKRMQRYINSFLFNYPIILDTLRFMQSRPSLEPAAENGSYFEKPIKTAAGENNIVEPEETSLIDKILEFLVISPTLLSYLIHLILNYYRFFKISSCESSEKKILISLNNIVPCELIVNKAYLHGLMKAVENISLDKVNLHTKNLSKFIYNYSDKLENIELCCCNFILFFFSIRHLIETHKTWVLNNIDDLFTKVDGQIRLLNKYIPQISGIPIKYEKCEKEELMSPAAEIKRLSEKYSYMKSMDQEKFAEFVFNDVGKSPKTAAEINIGIKNIIDLDSLVQNNENVSEFIDKLDKNKLNTILSYHKTEDGKISSNAFDLFMNYLENPVSLIRDKEKSSLIPNNVLNSFEKLKNLLNDSNFKKDHINTQYYYEKLMEVLPEDFQFPNVLYMIYQIVIPYMNCFYNVKLFEDVFLTTYKIV